MDLLQAVVERVRSTVSGARRALEAAPHVGVVAVDMPHGKIRHVNRALVDAWRWLGEGGEDLAGHLLPSLMHNDDAANLRKLLLAVRDAKPGCPKVGTSLPVRFLVRAGPLGLRSPPWMLVYSNPVTLTLAHVHGETPLSVGKLVFVVDLKRSEPNGVGVFSAHLMNRCYVITWDKKGMDPFEVFCAIRWMVPGASSSHAKPASLASAVRRALTSVTNFVATRGVELRITLSYTLSETDELVLTSEEQFTFVGGARFCTSEVAMLGQSEAADDVVFDNGEQRPADGNGEDKEASGKRQVAFVVTDTKAPLDSTVTCVLFGMQRVNGDLNATRMDFRSGHKFFSTQIEMPWSLGDASDRFLAHGKTVIATESSGGTVENILSRFRNLTLDKDPTEKAVTHTRGVWMVQQDSSKRGRGGPSPTEVASPDSELASPQPAARPWGTA
ncbi:hypothetical protein T484DRAFT_1816884 [Baffinella frigidus]|nr:hypothetical protein T484DRAFT_1816884 [Cryptophyta sp. CCMP2293]